MPIEKAYFWPRWFADSLDPLRRNKVPNKTIGILCRANLYLWRALNIYDDFLDGEGIAKELPAANGYYRRFLGTYYHLHLSPEFYQLFEHTLEDLDRANRKEAASRLSDGCDRCPHPLPPFKGLASLSRKSLPLGLGAVAIMDIAGGKHKRENITDALRIFRYALAAKQLSDDSCDWLDDLEAGMITPANALVLAAVDKKTAEMDESGYQKALYAAFIGEAAPKICTALKCLCSKARISAARVGLLTSSPLLSGLISPMEAAVARAEAVRSRFS